MSPADVLVHLGLPATGSRRLAAALAQAGDRFTARGVRLITSPELLGVGPLGPGDLIRLRPDADTALAAALHSAGAREATVVLPVRRQDHLLEYSHLDEVRAGSSMPFAEQFPHAADSVFDWAELAQRLRAVPGVGRIVVEPVETGLDPLRILLALAGGVDESASAVSPPPPGWSGRGIRVARALNAHLASDPERDLVRAFVDEHFAVPGRGNLFLSEVTRARVLAANAAANRRLFEDWLPDLPVESYLDDVHTAALEEA